MAAPKGNRFWETRAKHGLNKLYEDPEALWEDCCGYFQWVQDNPLYEAKLVTYQGEGSTHSVPKTRAMTLTGLCLYLGISSRKLSIWKNEREELRPVIEEAEQVITEQKFTEAAADQLNSNIIARDLGLRDGQDHTSSDGSMTPRGLDEFYADVSDEGDEPGEQEDEP